MISLIGLGNTGCKIVDTLSKYEQYNTIKINSGDQIKQYKTPEEYEEKCPNFKKLFKSIDGEVYLFLSAPGAISGAALRILEQLKGNRLNVVCIHSDAVTLSRVGNLQQNVVSGVLQEYARSGLLDSLYLLDNSKIEDFLEDVELDQYWDKINEVICYFFHTFMYFKNTKPLFESTEEENKIANIKTFGYLDKQNNKKMLFDLQNVKNEIYYYSYVKKIHGNSKAYLKQIKEKIQQRPLVVEAFKIYEGSENEETTYIVGETHIIQTLKE